MFEIFPVSMDSVMGQLEEYKDQLMDIWEQLLSLQSLEVSADIQKPFVQLSYDEISSKAVDEILGQLALSNGPIGFPLDINTYKVGSYLLYSINDLNRQLRQIDPIIIAAYEKEASLTEYFNKFNEEEDVSAEQYLILGVLECIKFCNNNHYALVVHW